MREELDSNRLQQMMEAIGRRARGPGRIYLVGGTTAVALGLRESTKDADLKLDPEPAGIFEVLRDLKEELHLNVELASPDHFIPAVPGWETRSLFIARHGQVEFFHYDPVGQALAKLERGHRQDLEDVRGLARLGLIDAARLRAGLESIRSALLRYPALDPDSFTAQVEAMASELERDG